MSNNKHKYFNKVPPFKPDHEQCTRKQHSWKEKESYDNDDDAWKFQNQNPKLKVLCCHTCLCKVSSKWHISKLHKQIAYER